jgi:hypothetical protein
MYATRTLHVCNPRIWQPFMSCQQSWTDPLPLRKMAPDPIHSTPVDRFAGPYPVSLPQQPLKQCKKFKHLLATSYIGLLGLYHQYVISTFNTCSWVPIILSLIDTGSGYNLGGADFSYHTPRLSQPMVLRFPLRAPTGLRLTFSAITFGN